MSGLNYKTVVVRYGELALKSQRVRRRFEETLIRNIDYALDKKNIIHSIKKEWGRIYVYGSKIEEITRVLTRIFGVTSVSPAFEVQSSVDVIGETVVLVLKSLSPQQGKSFALRVTRTGTHDFTSQSLAIKVGDVVRRTLNLVVDLDEPDVEVFIEVRGEKAFVYTEKLRGPGGLPAGTQG
ncbi:MAG TPA: tRNA 4-thiouridine(8) synthase ThiI, partial [Thermoplasmatales archaeon]|nr:tRNA 4-thiouridine(8) synthase ThiI [Thermoplasmatales archaeon]